MPIEYLKPAALAESGDDELDSRDGVQPLTEEMIMEYVLTENELPPESARPFAAWLYQVSCDFNEDGTATNGEIIEGALSNWCGGRSKG